jgi:hypothetical protein
LKFLYRWKFTFLLAVVLIILLAQPHLAETKAGTLVLAALSLIVQILTMVVVANSRAERIWSAAFGVPAVIAVLIGIAATAEARPTVMVWGHGVMAMFFAVSIVLVLRYVFLNEVTADHIVAALVAYLLIGVSMGQLYFVVDSQTPHAFRSSASIAPALKDPHTRSACLTYFSFVTLTTSGYGDIIPDAALTRTLAWMEAIAGQYYLAVLVAGLIGMRVSRSALARPSGES